MVHKDEDRPRNIDDDDDIKGRREDESDNAFSVQPASGSVIGGRRGSQEYGLTGEVSENESHGVHSSPTVEETLEGLEVDSALATDPIPYGEVTSGFPGVSEYSTESSRPDDLLEAKEESREPRPLTMSDDNLKGRIEKLLAGHENIDTRDLKINVHEGEVHLEGILHSHSAKLNIEEVLESLPGVKVIRDDVQVVI